MNKETSTVAADGRFIALCGSRNARHMGGYRAASGSVTRADRLYRSGWFDLNEPAGRQQLEALGITQIVDFRTEQERERQPLPVDQIQGVAMVSVPIVNGSMGAYLNKVGTMAAKDVDCRSAMTRMYSQMLDVGSGAFQRMLHSLTTGDGGAILICSTGKDRTGVGSALLLTALGVSRADVFADYEISADVYRGDEEEFARRHGYERMGHGLHLFRDVFTVYPEYLEAAWARASAIGGSMAEYASSAAGGDQGVARLRARFTTPAAKQRTSE